MASLSEPGLLAVMQPYFFPYIGYFQLVARSDRFVFYDDVQFARNSRSGWMNRNAVLLNGAPHWLTYPISKGHQLELIRDRRYRASEEDRQKVGNLLTNAYRKAPNYAAVFALVQEILEFPDIRVGAFNANLVTRIAQYLSLPTRFMSSSDLAYDRELKGPERILAICEALGARAYVNALGGIELYDPALFQARGVELRFLRSASPPYRQFGGEFVPNLSIIDVLMFCSVEETRAMLAEHELIAGQAVADSPSERSPVTS
jgi:hypothetical protein